MIKTIEIPVRRILPIILINWRLANYLISFFLFLSFT